MKPGDLARAILADLPGDMAVEEVHSWDRMTAVRCGRWGLAATPAFGDPVEGLDRLNGLTGSDLAGWLLGEQPRRAALGAACINALMAPPEGPDRNVVARLREWAVDRRVALVGRFPFAPWLTEVARELTVVELEPQPGEVAWQESRPVLAAAEVVCITGGCLVNHTLEQALQRSGKARIALVGPTVPPAASLLEAGIDLLAGLTLSEPTVALGVLRSGGSHRGLAGLRRWCWEA